jgi:P-type E1-E2 ATPase
MRVKFNGCEKAWFFGLAGVIIYFSILGRFLEERSRGESNYALQALHKIQSQYASVFKNGFVNRVPLSQIGVGDILIVKPGEVIPTDGVITVGKTAIDESRITGESLPIEKHQGDFVIGTTINRTANIQVRVTKNNIETLVSQLTSQVDLAQQNRAGLSGFRDKFASLYIPMILTGSFFIMIFFKFILGYGFLISFYIFCVIQVFSFPMVILLASPLVKMFETKFLLAKKIIVRDSIFYEIAHSINYFVFGKTGVLTKNKLYVTNFLQMERTVTKNDKNTLLTYAYNLERKVEHPISDAILRYYQQEARGPSSEAVVSEFKYFQSKGLVGKVDGKEVVIGGLKFSFRRQFRPHKRRD